MNTSKRQAVDTRQLAQFGEQVRMAYTIMLRQMVDERRLLNCIAFRSLLSGEAECDANGRYLDEEVVRCLKEHGDQALAGAMMGMLKAVDVDEEAEVFVPVEEELASFETLSISTVNVDVQKKTKKPRSKKPKNWANEEEPQQTYSPGGATLATLIPRLEAHLFDIDFLKNVSNSRKRLLDQYLSDLDQKRNQHPSLRDTSSFNKLKKTLQLVADKTTTLMSLDFEAHEVDKKTITEVGISIYDPAKDCVSLCPSFRTIHILIEETLTLRNGRFVNDHKDKFLGGDSIILSLEETRKFVQTVVDYYFIHRESLHGLTAALVGHGLSSDLAWLKSMGVKLPHGCKVVDTQELYLTTHPAGKSSLGSVLRRFDIPHGYLHNAGNDAYYTLVLLMKLSDPQFRRLVGVDSVAEPLFYSAKDQDRQVRESVDFFGDNEISAKRNGRKNTEWGVPIRIGTYEEALQRAFKQPKGF